MVRSSAQTDRRTVRPSDRASAVAALDSVETELIAIFADLSAALGLPRSLGQIYGLAYASVEPICFDDVVSKLGLSKGSASQGIRVLRELGALRVAPPGDARSDSKSVSPTNGPSVRRSTETPSSAVGPLSSGRQVRPGTETPSDSSTVRQFYLPEVSVRALLGAVMRQRVQPPLAAGAERLARLRAALPASLPSDRKPVRPSNRHDSAAGATDHRTAHLRGRVQSLESWHKKAKAFLPFLLKLSG